MTGQTMVVLACTLMVLLATAGSTDYSRTNCPICYNPMLNLPEDCTQGEDDEVLTQECGADQSCYVWKFAEDFDPSQADPPLGHTNYHKANRAMYLCDDAQGSETSILQQGYGGKTRDLEYATEEPAVSSTTENPFTMAPTEDGVNKTENAETDAPTEDNGEETPTKTSEVTTRVRRDPCVAGYFYNEDSEDKCEKCPLHTYRAEGADDTSCTDCPDGTATGKKGATSADECFDACGPGRVLKNDRTGCRDCKENFFSKESHNIACEECETGTKSDAGASSCVVVACPARNHVSGHGCDACPAGTYMDEDDNTATECKTCEEGYTSESGEAKCVPVKKEEETGPGENAGYKATVPGSLLLTLIFILASRL